ncbi:MAG: hypothetical protein NTZ93_02830 [Candidatus Beckwithbacteria bacterium]|nr:hypothetical protein [Candidatus Beckwithbacteria bacterium]
MIKFLFVWILLCLFSFSQQDLNLTLYNFSWWNPIRIWIQHLGFYQRPLNTVIFLVLSLLLIIIYLNYIRKKHSTPEWNVLIFLTLSGVLAYPLFSYDVFNYLFNAKMVIIYHVNPHIKTAIEFAFDPLLRFMHNVQTPAPYAYGWTGISLLPGLVWFSHNFTLTFWTMKLFVALFWLGQLWILKKLVNRLFPHEPWRWSLFAFCPLVLIETLIVGHNDVVMMFSALLSYWFFLNSNKFKSIILLIFSASIKYVTILLLPFYYLQVLSLKAKRIDLPTLFSVILLGVMLTRPGQLHSWYLIWAFSFAVLAKSKWVISIFTALTIGALLRYAPYLYFGHWDPPVYLLRNLIWLGSIFFTPFIKRKMVK